MSAQAPGAAPWPIRPDTGMNTARLGMWLFLAAEAMFFGALFSAYVLLRTAHPAWPQGTAVFSPALGVGAAAAMAVGSLCCWRGFRALRSGSPTVARAWFAAACGAGALFLLNVWTQHGILREHGMSPRVDTFLAIAHVLAGAHAVHAAAGIAVLAWFIGPGWRLQAQTPERQAVRLANGGLYWHFLTLTWFCVTAALYA